MKDDVFDFRKNGTDSALIFLHGFTGNYRKTWGDFPIFLIAHPDLTDWDVISIQFTSNLFIPELRGLWKAAPDIQKLADTLATRIRTAFGSYRRIAFVAHSMGGLVVRRALLDCETTRRKTSHLFLFGTPSNGLVKAAIGMKITGKRQIRDMAEGGPFIDRLRRDWEREFGYDNFPFHFQSVAGDQDEFVPATSAHGNFPRAHCQSIRGGHLDIVKPNTKNDLAVEIVARGLAEPEKDKEVVEVERGNGAGTENDVPGEPLPDATLEISPKPGKTMTDGSPFYVRRRADDEVWEEVLQDRGTAILRAPRQTGKSSLLVALLHRLAKENFPIRMAFIDLQHLRPSEMESVEGVWRTIARCIAERLKIPGFDSNGWDSESTLDRNLTGFLEKFVFAADKRPLLICLDEADRLLKSTIGNHFFSTARAFINEAAYSETWRRVRWVISSSSEPSFFITNVRESAFNVGETFHLDPFTPDETNQLAAALGVTLDEDRVQRIQAYLGGRPYLVHLLLYRMKRRDPADWERLFHAQSAGGGVFLEHLGKYQKKFGEEPELARAMKRIIEGKGCGDARLCERLESAGLARRKRRDREKWECACGLYAAYFRGTG